MQYDINREAAKISELWSRKIDKYDYLTGKEILSFNQMIEQVKLEYYPLGKAFEKQNKTKKNKKIGWWYKVSRHF